MLALAGAALVITNRVKVSSSLVSGPKLALADDAALYILKGPRPTNVGQNDN